jgi:hypothetical protein
VDWDVRNPADLGDLVLVRRELVLQPIFRHRRQIGSNVAMLGGDERDMYLPHAASPSITV